MLEQIKYLVDIDILKQHTIEGDELTCLCPFHDEQKPSFGINLRSGKYNCFSCGEAGLSFESFFKKIKDNYDINIEELEKDKIKIMNNQIQRIQIDNSTKEGINYLEEEIFDKYDDPLEEYIYNRIDNIETIEAFEIRYDKFNNRYIIPIRHYNQKLMGFVYRQFVEPKYKYNFGFDKRLTLFGIDKITSDKCIITEGQFDVINCCDKGHENCVAIMGKKMSTEQEILILNFFDEIIIALDNDEAGKTGTIDMIKRLRSKIKIKAFSWITGKSDLGDLSKEELNKELNNLLEIRG